MTQTSSGPTQANPLFYRTPTLLTFQQHAGIGLRRGADASFAAEAAALPLVVSEFALAQRQYPKLSHPSDCGIGHISVINKGRWYKGWGRVRRLLALASIYDGGSRTYAARIGAVTVQIVRDWVLRFNERGPDGLINGKAPGVRARLNAAQRQALVKIVESGPIPAVHGVVRWRRKDLV